MVLGPRATALGFTTGLWLSLARAERVVRGAVDDSTVRDWFAAVNDGIPENAVVMRMAIGFVIPKALILIVMQDPGVVCPCNGCCDKLSWLIPKNRHPTGQAPHGGRRRSDRRRKHQHVRGWKPPSEYHLHSSELLSRQGRHGLSLLELAMFLFDRRSLQGECRFGTNGYIQRDCTRESGISLQVSDGQDLICMTHHVAQSLTTARWWQHGRQEPDPSCSVEGPASADPALTGALMSALSSGVAFD